MQETKLYGKCKEEGKCICKLCDAIANEKVHPGGRPKKEKQNG